MSDLLVLGNITIDDVVTADSKISPTQLGGNGVYAAAGVRLWDHPVSLVGVIGNDFPRELLGLLASAGVNVDGIHKVDMPHFLRSRVFYLPDGTRTDRVQEAASILPPHAGEVIDLVSEYTEMGSALHRRYWPIFAPHPELLRPEHFKARFTHLSPGPLTNNRGNAIALKQGSNRQMQISMDWPWWDWDREAIADHELLANIDFLLPSKEEFAMHADALANPDWTLVGRALLALGPRVLAIKMSSQGAQVLLPGNADWVLIPVFPTAAIDPTGAGDSFCGGFIVGMAETGDPLRAALYGAVSASFIIENFGFIDSLRIHGTQARARLQALETQYPTIRLTL